MKITDTLNFFLNLKDDSVEKSDVKVYNKYIGILSALKNRDLTDKQIQSIEAELESLSLKTESGDSKKYLNQKLSEFQKFLKDSHDLVSEGYYAGIGAGTGIVFGSIFSLLFQSFIGTYSLLIGIIGGMTLGGILGGIKDAQAKKHGRVLITK